MKALRVLLVEDDALIAVLLAELLGGMGYEVCSIASTEAEAVTAAARYEPDLMIVDDRLGRGSGVSAVEEICRTRRIPHVFVSGNPDSVRFRHPDATVIGKPFRDTQLFGAIATALQAPSTS